MNVEEIAFKYALANAVKYGGKADVKAVMAKLMAEVPELRARAREVKQIVDAVVARVNSMPLEEQRRILRERWPELLEERRAEQRRPGLEGLPELPNVRGGVVVRFAPNPDFVLHLGSARPAILNYAYRIKYGGKFILRFEDTDPRIKSPLVTEEVNAYESIREDLRWLGVRWDEEYIQSQRMEIYYEHAKKLLEMGAAYVDLCKPEEWRRLRNEKKACPHREQPPEVNLELWDKMLEGRFKEGEAVLRIKTDLTHPDPSVRDWVAFRIIDTSKTPHPLTGDKYIVWPTYNFAVSIDDHLMGVTHVLRAQEHSVNTIKQSYVFRHFGWEQPVTIHFGRLRIEGATLSKSKLKAMRIKYDDLTLPTLAGLRNRGIVPEAIWDLILSVGIKPSDSTVALANLFAFNRKHIEPIADRYMYVADPVKLVFEADKELTAHVPFHPSFKERGERTYRLGPGRVEVYIQRRDAVAGKVVRLMELANVEIVRVEGDVAYGRIHSYSLDEAKKIGAPIIQWVWDPVEITVIKPAGVGRKEVEVGLGEGWLERVEVGKYVQFFRYGYLKKRGPREFVFLHD
ncbi:glutamate--tRNA ligase [Pyrobaculum aerophilum]|uniref:Glutamate--tRNA ligase n=2 Tax=Pyrobaculum aerophilum TaxID=13773 RepID=SYE_PYRAE|nr:MULTISPECIES: glutamate--tRNA ligase [Pyrobaculum]Q8ZU33.1 RecName: Full=Glutamate--tRNA ligase; AltName: Full=Glutamyl-tRNA synthetase; Short=GluRS [Pyrobaculum aerophilum str. IM2]AAL64575.1 glutamyl-tRNA synthetase [Pyrobaculum aerophilum str. IM2]MCX8137265.1 glutamate--tRNA ligase [Pyrobaculum aerophilum]HII47419.1 glutamate--tRNA ligase [Pyrobaculum aerophilum]